LSTNWSLIFSRHAGVNVVPTPLTAAPLVGGLVTPSTKPVTIPGRPRWVPSPSRKRVVGVGSTPCSAANTSSSR